MGDSKKNSKNKGDFKNLEMGKRIEALMKARNLSQAELARKIGSSPSTVQSYIFGGYPKGDYAVALGEALNCSIDWLLTGKGDDPESALSAGPVSQSGQVEVSRQEGGKVNVLNLTLIPKAKARLSAGDGAVVLQEGLGGVHSFRTEWIKKYANNTATLILIDVDGDSMEPTISDGATVLVDRARNKLSDGIYAIGLHDMVMIKRIAVVGSAAVKIKCDNPNYEAFEVPLGDLRIIGKVIWSARSLI